MAVRPRPRQRRRVLRRLHRRPRDSANSPSRSTRPALGEGTERGTQTWGDETRGDQSDVAFTSLTSDDLVGTAVYGADDNWVGEISELALTETARSRRWSSTSAASSASARVRSRCDGPDPAPPRRRRHVPRRPARLRERDARKSSRACRTGKTTRLTPVALTDRHDGPADFRGAVSACSVVVIAEFAARGILGHLTRRMMRRASTALIAAMSHMPSPQATPTAAASQRLAPVSAPGPCPGRRRSCLPRGTPRRSSPRLGDARGRSTRDR